MEPTEGDTPKTPVEEELVGRVTWQIQLRWFAALGVAIAAWIATSIFELELSPWPLYIVGLSILLYNTAFWVHARWLERQAISEAAAFDRFAKIQTSLDWLAMILLVHYSGGVESPLIFYFIFHLIMASILLSRRACYLFATLAALAVGALALLEYGELVPHVSSGLFPIPLYQNEMYAVSVLFFFVTSLYISAYLATSVTANLRQKDEELLRLQQRLASAYQRIQTLYDVTTTVSSTLDLDEVLTRIARRAAEAMQVKACSIRLLDKSGHVVETVASYGLSTQFLTKGPIDVQKSLVTQQALSGQPVIASDISQDGRLQYAAEALAEGIYSMLCVPLSLRGRVEGVVCVYSGKVDHFTRNDADFLAALASGGASAIANARAYQALERADQAKSEFVRMVTHELRSPLSAVQSMLKLMAQGYVGPMAPKQLDLVQRSQRRIASLLALVRDLLDLAAGKIEQFKGDKQELALNEIITKVTDLMQSSAVEKELDYRTEITEEPLVLIGVEEALERVFMNLVSNAVKYTPSGGSVTVKAWGESDRIKVEVSDTGIGIPEDALPRIFTEFYRAKNARAVEMEGTGLGLAIAQDIVQQHDGQISVKSSVNRGSTFSVTLPRG